MQPFRLPASALNRHFLQLGIGVLICMVLLPFFLPLGFSTSTFILAALFIGGIYFYTKQYVWVRLSAEGIHGTGYTGRDVHIPWHEPVTVNKARKSNMDGVEIRLTENDQLLRKQILSVFIPQAIVSTQEFSATLAQLAPANHTLRATVKNTP